MKAACRDQAVEVIADYESRDPYTIRMTFRAGESCAEWLFSRELLITGMGAPSGAGDVRITPGDRTIALHLDSPSGAATLVFVRRDLTRFLSRTFEEVMPGYEDDHLDWSDLPRPALPGGAA